MDMAALASAGMPELIKLADATHTTKQAWQLGLGTGGPCAPAARAGDSEIVELDSKSAATEYAKCL